MSCKSRTALNVCGDRVERSWAGYHRCYGETCVSIGTRVELNVGRLCMNNQLLICQWNTQRDPDCVLRMIWGDRYRSCRQHGPISRRPGLPGIKLSTYRTKGSLREHGNLKLSAGTETAGKPPSLAMSQLRGGVSVVVRARESRVHGEGRQSMSMAARPLG